MASTNDWWASLTINQKERIATKAKAKANPEQPMTIVRYPQCSTWWVEQTEDERKWIMDHCTDKHGYLLPDWQEGRSLSY